MEAEQLHHLMIRASAGTGKTFQLSNRFLRLLLRPTRPDRVLATTFTRKAAGEILDRVIVRVARAAIDPEELRRLARELQVDSLSPEACLRLTEDLLSHLHRLRICTLDSHYSQVARGLSLELGLPPHWRVVEVWEERALRDRALESVLQNQATGELHTLTHLLTKGESSRTVADLLRSTIDDLHGLYGETTAAAWKGPKAGQLLDSDELLAAMEALRDANLSKALNLSRREDLLSLSLQDWDQFVRRGIPSKLIAGETAYRRATLTEDVVRLYQPLMDHARAVLLQRIATQTEASYRLLDRFDESYQTLKRRAGALRFDDVTHSLAQWEDRQRSQLHLGDRVAFRTDGEIDHLLLDEFQDTSPAQWRALRTLAERIGNSSDGKQTFFCVGDTKQAIYGWRGGVAEIFDWVEQEFVGLQRTQLNQSFRSAQPVIDTVNLIFQGVCRHPNLERHEAAVRNWSEAFPVHQTERAELTGLVHLVTAPRGDTSQQEMLTLAAAADRVRSLHDRIPQATIGVLVRRNATIGKLIYLLRERGLFASEEGGNPLTDSAAVDLVLSALRLVDHPGDTTARFHLFHSPLADAVGLKTLDDDGQTRQVARQLRQHLMRDGYAATLTSWTNLLQPHLSRRENNRLRQLVDLAAHYADRESSRTVDFIRFVEQEKVVDPSSSTVRVMTIHQAKGLQFDAVVLPELDGELVGQPRPFVVERPDPTQPVTRVCRYVNTDLQKLLPSSYQQMFEDEARRSVAESLCLLYVAVTRPIHALEMVIAPPSPKERNLPKRYSGLLRAALTDGTPAEESTTLYSCGDENWEIPSSRVAASPKSQPAGAIRFASSRRTRGWERVSPSQLEGGARVRAKDLLTPDETSARRHGTLVHALMEQIEWLDDFEWDRKSGRQWLQRHLTAEDLGATADALLGQFEATLQQPQVRRAMTRSYYQSKTPWGEPETLTAEVRREHTFAIAENAKMLVGTIDRLVILRRDGKPVGADVIDFKTDRLGGPGRSVADKLLHYRPQIEAYRQAVAKVLDLDLASVRGQLLFLQADELVVVE